MKNNSSDKLKYLRFIKFISLIGLGYESPTTIQQRGIIPLIEGKNTIAQGQPGSGKTATYSIGILQVIEESLQQTQVLVLAPTRELCQQIGKDILKLGEYLKVSVQVCTGGEQFSEDKKALNEGAQVVVGTPESVHDIIDKGLLQTQEVKMIIIDEADEMLAHGNRDQIQQILKFLQEYIQIGVFSTIVPPEIFQVTRQFISDPAIILVEREEFSLDDIRQYYVELEQDDWKYETFKELYKNLEFVQCIVNCNSDRRVVELAQKLKEDNIIVCSMHTDITQEERDLQVKEFRCGTQRILITTDLLSRGLNFPMVNLVINYDLPELKDKEQYFLRTKKSGRFGRNGKAISFNSPSDGRFLLEVEKFYSTKIREMPLDDS